VFGEGSWRVAECLTDARSRTQGAGAVVAMTGDFGGMAAATIVDGIAGP
jgi:hypothetical protein